MNKIFYANITKSEDSANGDFITVGGIASSNVVDSDGEIITTEAMSKARDNYLKFPAIREMHQAIAAGKCTKFEILENGDTYIEAEIYDSETMKKVKAGVLRAFSIGGKALKKVGNTIVDLILSEISVVDRPANPNSVMTFYKADMNFIKENEMTEEVKQEQVAVIEDVTKSNEVVDVQAVVEPEIKKGLDDVARLAYLVQELAWLQDSMEDEANWEQDNSKLPEDLKNIVKSLFALLNASVKEETTEMATMMDSEKADSNNDINKADNLTNDFENDKLNNNESKIVKAGSRNSKEDLNRIQQIHDLALELGAVSPNYIQSEKSEVVDLKKFEDKEKQLTEDVSNLVKTVETLKSKIAELEKLPVPMGFVKSEFKADIATNQEVDPVVVNGKVDEHATAIKKSLANGLLGQFFK